MTFGFGVPLEFGLATAMVKSLERIVSQISSQMLSCRCDWSTRVTATLHAAQADEMARQTASKLLSNGIAMNARATVQTAF